MFADDDFTGVMAINLEVGREYNIVEYYGMVGIRGEYIGIADRQGTEKLLVFRVISKSYGEGEVPESERLYCGCYLRAELPYSTRSGRAKVYLQQTHYGQSIATLRKVGSIEDNRWEIRE